MSDPFVDPVVAEIHATRAAMLEAAGGSVAQLMQQVADRQKRSHQPIIREPLPGRAVAPPGPEPRSRSSAEDA